jgi:uncharacterized RDD family membrane protein YckC
MRDSTLGTLDTLCTNLDESIAAGLIDPENVTARLEVFRPVEQAMMGRSELPKVPDSHAGRIISALWYKTHPPEAHVDELLSWVKDEASIVRFAAVDALDTLLRDSAQSTLDPASSTRARRALEEQRATEPSPILRYQLGELANGLGNKARTTRRHRAAPVRANPYLAGLPVRDPAGFFGRTDVIAQIARHLDTPGVNSVIIHGARRTGKTSLLHRLRHGALGDDCLAVYVDLQSVAGEPLEQLIATLANAIILAVRREIAEDTSLPPTLPEPCSLAAFQGWIRDVVAAIEPRKLVVLLDEYEVMAQHLRQPNAARQFQSMYEGVAGVAWVFAGARKVESLTEKSFVFLLDTSKYIRISFLSPADTELLIREPARDTLTFSPQVIEAIRALTAGHPFYTQLLCQTIFELAIDDHVVSMEHVRIAADRFVSDPSPHLILTWTALGFDEQIVGTAMAMLQKTPDTWVAPEDVARYLRREKFTAIPSLGRIRQAVGGLREIDFVVKRPGADAYQLPMGLVRQWVAESRSIWTVLQKHREQQGTRTAGRGSLVLAFMIDAVLSLLFFALTLFVMPFELEVAGVVTALLIVLAAYSLSYARKEGTPGMRFMDLRVHAIDGEPLTTARAVALGAAFVARVALWLLILVTVYSWLPPATWEGFHWIGIVAIAVEIAQIVLRLTSAERRGLYDRLTRTVVWRDPKPPAVVP